MLAEARKIKSPEEILAMNLTLSVDEDGMSRMREALRSGISECPLHQGTFDICTGKALTAPAYDDLCTYPVKVEDGTVYIRI